MKNKRLYISLLFSLIFVGSLYAQQGIQGYIDSGNKNIQNRNFKGAIDDFDNALKIQPSDTAALSGIIKACLFADDLKNAQKYIDNAIKNYPNNAEYILRRGIYNNKKGQFEKAIEDFNLAISQNPKNELLVQIYQNLGATELILQTYDAAISDYNKALELSPRNPSLYNYKGYANYKKGNFIDAINDFNNAIDLDPNNAASYYNRGMTFLKTSEKSNACMDFHKACNLGNINACKMIMSECSSK